MNEEMPTREDERRARVVKLTAYPRGNGVVELLFEQRGKMIGGAALVYGQSGQLVGAPRTVDEQAAHEFNAALDYFNDKLDEWCA